jgi:hypothetical protein
MRLTPSFRTLLLFGAPLAAIGSPAMGQTAVTRDVSGDWTSADWSPAIPGAGFPQNNPTAGAAYDVTLLDGASSVPTHVTISAGTHISVSSAAIDSSLTPIASSLTIDPAASLTTGAYRHLGAQGRTVVGGSLHVDDTLDLAGGQLVVSGAVTTGPSAAFTVGGSATLQLDGGAVTAPRVSVQAGTLIGRGTVHGSVTVGEFSNLFAGPGQQGVPGDVTVDGDLDFEVGTTLTINLDADSNSHVYVGGALTTVPDGTQVDFVAAEGTGLTVGQVITFAFAGSDQASFTPLAPVPGRPDLAEVYDTLNNLVAYFQLLGPAPTGNGQFAFRAQVLEVPEPSALLLGVASVALMTRRRRG